MFKIDNPKLKEFIAESFLRLYSKRGADEHVSNTIYPVEARNQRLLEGWPSGLRRVT